MRPLEFILPNCQSARRGYAGEGLNASNRVDVRQGMLARPVAFTIQTSVQLGVTCTLHRIIVDQCMWLREPRKVFQIVDANFGTAHIDAVGTKGIECA